MKYAQLCNIPYLQEVVILIFQPVYISSPTEKLHPSIQQPFICGTPPGIAPTSVLAPTIAEPKSTPVTTVPNIEDDLDLDLEGINLDENIDTTVSYTSL